MATDEITPGNSLEQDNEEEWEVQGIFLMPMSHHFAEHLVEELAPLALQLGPHAREFYEGIAKGVEDAKGGKTGLLYDSNDVHGDS